MLAEEKNDYMKLSIKGSKAKSATPTPSSRSATPGRTSLEGAWSIAFLVALVLFAALGYFVHERFADQDSRARTTQLKQLAAGYAGQLDAYVRQLTESVDYAAKEPTLAAALASGNAQTIADKEGELSYLFPSAIRLRLLPAGFDTPDENASPPLSYACLDMIQRAEHNEVPPAEVHLPGTPQQHIDFVRAINSSGGQVLGTLLVTIPVQALQQALQGVLLDGGYLELRQPIGDNRNVVLARSGAAPADPGKPSVSLPIRNTSWQLGYWPPVAGGADEILFWAMFGAAALLFGIVTFLLYKAVASALMRDHVTMIRLWKDAADGTLAPSYAASLKNDRGAIAQLHHMARDSGGNRRPGQSAAKPEAEDAYADLSLAPDALEVQELAPEPAAAVSANIFRAYDIRGVVGETLTPEVVYEIGRAIGSEAHERGQQKVIVARDGRLSGPELGAALVRGLVASGREVIDIGRVPTPVLYFATHYLGSGSGVMLTGSHNPANYNGMKIMLRGETLHGDDIQLLRNRIETANLLSGEGSVQTIDVSPSYLDRITGDVRLARPLKVVVDCGNGVSGELAPQLLRQLGCEVIELFCEIDGNFPNHHPDPGKPENLVALIRAVTDQGADVGLAFDGDGDRLGVVDSEGKIIWPDRVLMLLALDVLLRQPGGQIIYDVKCTRHLEHVIRENGGEPLMSATGHSLIKAKMIETGALLAGEMSGHIFFKERWFGFDDALYAGARLLEILAAENRRSSELFGELPESVSTPELNVSMAEGEHFALMQRLIANARFGGARMITIDGLRVEFPDGWGLVRASNTTPCLVLRFEADDAEALRRIQDEFRHQLLELDSTLDLPF